MLNDETALLSLVLTLRPLAASLVTHDEGVPHGLDHAPIAEQHDKRKGSKSLGRAAHALLLNAIRWADPVLSDELHAGTSLRPFTASELIGYSRKYGVMPGRVYTLRFTALVEPVARALLEALTPNPSPKNGRGEPSENGPLSVGALVRLDEAMFRIEEVYIDAESRPWADSTSYETLSAPWLLGRKKPDSRLTLHFASPTTFKSGGKHLPVPLPALVFGGLLDRWNAFAPVALPPELRRYADECLVLAGYRLRTRMVSVKEGGLRTGAIGYARYTTVNYDRYWMSLINLLADFSLYAGVGAGVSMGLGQCRRVADFPSWKARVPRENGHAVVKEQVNGEAVP